MAGEPVCGGIGLLQSRVSRRENKEEVTLNVWKKLLAMLIAVILLLSVMPAAFAEENNGAAAETTAPAEADEQVETTAPVETTTPTETTAATEAPSWRVNYSDLELKIAMVNGLNAYEYTIESWTVLEETVAYGNRILKWRLGQQNVDEAEEAIDLAMAGLVKMDYSRLDAALNEVYRLVEENPEVHDVWGRLDDAAASAKPLLISGDQAAVNQAAEELNALLAELAGYTEEASPSVEVVVQEVEVEVLPTGDYCNIPVHRTWPVLFVISAVLNVALIVVLTYVLMRKRNTVDNTPLVSYDIDDDMDF